MHSKPKLALAVITSPGAAFEEIVKRKLLGTGLVIAAIAGVLSMITPIASGMHHHVELLLIGKLNPLCWMGLFLLYAFILHKLLNWLGTKNEFTDILTIMGWAQILLLITQAAAGVNAIMDAAGVRNQMVMQFASTIYMAFPLFYVLVIGAGIQAIYKVPFFRGALSYLIVAVMAIIAMGQTYGMARLEEFKSELSSIPILAQAIARNDMIPWLAVSVIGLVLGLWTLGRKLGWDRRKCMLTAVSAGLAGSISFGLYFQYLSHVDYYGMLFNVQNLFETGKYEASAEEMKKLFSIADEPSINLDIAGAYYLAGNSAESLKYYQEYLNIVSKTKTPETAYHIAIAHNYLGVVYDADGKHDLAVKEFRLAIKKWREFREPWNRIAITYNRMGDYKKAIDAARHSVDKLESKTAVPWIALAQAYAQTNDITQAKAAIAMVVGKDPDMAKKMGKNLDDWKTAVNKLTRDDLKFPLEKEYVQPPPKEKEKGKK